MATAYADFPAALLGWLRGQPTVVSAFAEDTSSEATTKFWADSARRGVALPWAVYEELPGPLTYLTGDAGNRPMLEELTIRFTIVAEGRQAARNLGTMIASALTDPPLEFADGRLMCMRPSGASFSPVASIEPGSPGAVARVLSFHVMIQRSS